MGFASNGKIKEFGDNDEAFLNLPHVGSDKPNIEEFGETDRENATKALLSDKISTFAEIENLQIARPSTSKNRIPPCYNDFGAIESCNSLDAILRAGQEKE